MEFPNNAKIIFYVTKMLQKHHCSLNTMTPMWTEGHVLLSHNYGAEEWSYDIREETEVKTYYRIPQRMVLRSTGCFTHIYDGCNTHTLSPTCLTHKINCEGGGCQWTAVGKHYDLRVCSFVDEGLRASEVPAHTLRDLDEVQIYSASVKSTNSTIMNDNSVEEEKKACIGMDGCTWHNDACTACAFGNNETCSTSLLCEWRGSACVPVGGDDEDEDDDLMSMDIPFLQKTAKGPAFIVHVNPEPEPIENEITLEPNIADTTTTEAVDTVTEAVDEEETTEAVDEEVAAAAGSSSSASSAEENLNYDEESYLIFIIFLLAVLLMGVSYLVYKRMFQDSKESIFPANDVKYNTLSTAEDGSKQGVKKVKTPVKKVKKEPRSVYSNTGGWSLLDGSDLDTSDDEPETPKRTSSRPDTGNYDLGGLGGFGFETQGSIRL